jgi:hypothetical protein
LRLFPSHHDDTITVNYRNLVFNLAITLVRKLKAHSPAHCVEHMADENTDPLTMKYLPHLGKDLWDMQGWAPYQRYQIAKEVVWLDQYYLEWGHNSDSIYLLWQLKIASSSVGHRTSKDVADMEKGLINEKIDEMNASV